MANDQKQGEALHAGQDSPAPEGLIPEADAQEQQTPWRTENEQPTAATGPKAIVPEADWLEQGEMDGPPAPRRTDQPGFKLSLEIPEADYAEQMMSAYEGLPDEE